MNVVWTEDEKEYVRANAGFMRDEDVASDLSKITGRVITRDAVRRQRQKMGLRKRQGRGVCRLADPLGVVRFSPKRPFGIPLTIRAATPPPEGATDDK